MKPTLKFICSKHGEQKWKCFFFAGVELACGCRFKDVDGKLVKDASTAQNRAPRMLMASV